MAYWFAFGFNMQSNDLTENFKSMANIEVYVIGAATVGAMKQLNHTKPHYNKL